MADLLSARTFVDGLVAEFAVAVESVLGTTITVAPSTVGDGHGWTLRITLSGALSGTMAVWTSEADAVVLAQRVMSMDEAPDTATIVDMLREMWTQAASALALKEPFTRVKAALDTPAAGAPESDGLAAYELHVAEGVSVRLSLAGDVTVTPIAASIATPAPPPTRSSALVAAAPEDDANARLEVVLDIDLPLIVRFGRTSMSLKALADLGPGSIVDMGRSPDEPVEMLIGDRVIARGEVVVVGGNYGVRIMDLVSPVERARTVGR
jgi:flagellar motor switch protein FliN